MYSIIKVRRCAIIFNIFNFWSNSNIFGRVHKVFFKYHQDKIPKNLTSYNSSFSFPVQILP